MTAIQPVVCGSSAMALQASAYLRDHGFHVAAIRPPTVPEGSARLRITLNAHHQADEVERLLAALEGAISHALKTETST
jgi:8-amino-7-oxononanoate synthase